MKRTAAALSIVAIACGHAPVESTPTIPAQPPQPRASAPAPSSSTPPPNEVLRRIVQGGEVFALLGTSCETLVVAAGKTPEERALEIDTTQTAGCSTKRKTGVLLDVTDPRRLKCVGARQTVGRTSIVIGCPIETPHETSTPRTNEAVVSGVRLFSDRDACLAMIAPETMAREPSCFETELGRAVEQRREEPPKGDFIARFERLIDDPNATVWQRSDERGGICESWHVKRTVEGFAFFRDRVEKKITTVHSEASYAYDAQCKRVTAGARSTTWTTPGYGGRGTSTRGSWSSSLSPAEHEDELPITGDWFYTRRGCERSPR